eukprot:gene21541-28532_t
MPTPWSTLLHFKQWSGVLPSSSVAQRSTPRLAKASNTSHELSKGLVTATNAAVSGWCRMSQRARAWALVQMLWSSLHKRHGIIGAVRPWVGVPVSFLWSSGADYFKVHQPLMTTLNFFSVATRWLLLFVPARLWPMMAVIVVVEGLRNPVSAMADSACMKGCTEDGEYGKHRLWGAIGWGVVAAVAGAVIDRWGIESAFICNALLMLPGFIAGWFMHYPVDKPTKTRPSKERQAKPPALTQINLDLSLPLNPDLSNPGSVLYTDASRSQLELSHLTSDHSALHHGRPYPVNEATTPVYSLGHEEDDLPIGTEIFSTTIAQNAAAHPEASGTTSKGTYITNSILATATKSTYNTASVPSTATKGSYSTDSEPTAAATCSYHDGSEPTTSQCIYHGDSSCPSKNTARHRNSIGASTGPLGARAGPEYARAGPSEEAGDLSRRRGSLGGRGGSDDGSAGSELGETDRLLGSEASDDGGGGGGGGDMERGATRSRKKKGELELDFMEKMKILFTSPEIGLFLFTSLVMGTGFGIISTYLFLMLQEMGSSDFLMGLTLTVTVMLEVPVFHYMGDMIKWFGCKKRGVERLLDICLATYVVRLLFYSVLPFLVNPYYVLPAELLHGITFGVGWGAGCEKAKMLAPEGLEATMQIMFQGCYFGLGFGCGSLFGGLLGPYGFQFMFFWSAILVLIGWGLVMVGRVFIKSTNR